MIRRLQRAFRALSFLLLSRSIRINVTSIFLSRNTTLRMILLSFLCWSILPLVKCNFWMLRRFLTFIPLCVITSGSRLFSVVLISSFKPSSILALMLSLSMFLLPLLKM